MIPAYISLFAFGALVAFVAWIVVDSTEPHHGPPEAWERYNRRRRWLARAILTLPLTCPLSPAAAALLLAWGVFYVVRALTREALP